MWFPLVSDAVTVRQYGWVGSSACLKQCGLQHIEGSIQTPVCVSACVIVSVVLYTNSVYVHVYLCTKGCPMLPLQSLRCVALFPLQPSPPLPWALHSVHRLGQQAASLCALLPRELPHVSCVWDRRWCEMSVLLCVQ